MRCEIHIKMVNPDMRGHLENPLRSRMGQQNVPILRPFILPTALKTPYFKIQISMSPLFQNGLFYALRVVPDVINIFDARNLSKKFDLGRSPK